MWICLPAPPTFLETPPAFVEVRDQAALSLTCRAVGNPQPVVTWKRSDLPVQSGDTVQVRTTNHWSPLCGVWAGSRVWLECPSPLLWHLPAATTLLTGHVPVPGWPCPVPGWPCHSWCCCR